MDRLRGRIEAFLTALEEERYQIDLAQRRRPTLGELYAGYPDLFSIERITEVQRALAGSGGAEERRNRTLLEFLATGRAIGVAGDPLDQRIGWEIFGSVALEESRIPVRQIAGALAVAAEPGRRHAVEEAFLRTLEEQEYLADEFLAAHREGIAELGYGSHVDAFQVLGSVDLRTIAREGERFLAESEPMYRELLGWFLPRVAGVEAAEARAADGIRLEAAPEYDGLLRGAEGHRLILETLSATGLDPLAEGRIRVEWEAYLGVAAGAVCRTPDVPREIRLSVTPRAGRPAVASFLNAYGMALHHAYTDPDLPLEHRRLGDEAVPRGSGALLESLLSAPYFLTRVYGFPKARLEDYLRHSALLALLGVRREIGRLLYELAYYDEDAGGDAFADLLTEATGLRHDPRAARWSSEGDFASARRLRGSQLGAVLAATLRQRYDEDWFRNPEAGDYLKGLFQNGRRFSALEVAVQLSSGSLGWGPLLEQVREMV